MKLLISVLRKNATGDFRSRRVVLSSSSTDKNGEFFSWAHFWREFSDEFIESLGRSSAIFVYVRRWCSKLRLLTRQRSAPLGVSTLGEDHLFALHAQHGIGRYYCHHGGHSLLFAIENCSSSSTWDTLWTKSRPSGFVEENREKLFWKRRLNEKKNAIDEIFIPDILLYCLDTKLKNHNFYQK